MIAGPLPRFKMLTIRFLWATWPFVAAQGLTPAKRLPERCFPQRENRNMTARRFPPPWSGSQAADLRNVCAENSSSISISNSS